MCKMMVLHNILALYSSDRGVGMKDSDASCSFVDRINRGCIGSFVDRVNRGLNNSITDVCEKIILCLSFNFL